MAKLGLTFLTIGLAFIGGGHGWGTRLIHFAFWPLSNLSDEAIISTSVLIGLGILASSWYAILGIILYGFYFLGQKVFKRASS